MFLSERERARHRPDMYLGDTSTVEGPCVCLFEQDKKWNAEIHEASLSPVLRQFVYELTSNCLDQVARDETFRKIHVCIEPDGSMVFFNDGKGIPVPRGIVQSSDPSHQQLYTPTLLMGRFGCSTNYDDSGHRMTVGRNGVGAKVTFAWCSKVVVETRDVENHLWFSQTWERGMEMEHDPIVKRDNAKKGFTRIHIWPDWSLIALRPPLSSLQLGALRWHVLQCTTMLPTGNRYGVKIDTIPIRDHSMRGILRLLLPNPSELVHATVVHGQGQSMEGFAFPRQPNLPPLSVVNGLPVPHGSHVSKFESALRTAVSKRIPRVTPSFIQEYFSVCVVARVDRPVFGSQTKTSLVSKFQASFPPLDLNPVRKTISQLSEHVKQAELAQTRHAVRQTKRPQRYVAVDNYESAKMHRDASLFLTEGLSAQNLARMVIAQLSPKERDRCGSFALRGKLINATSHTEKRLYANKEVAALMKICNLDPSLTYESSAEQKSLRYKRVVLFTDQDEDGGHIGWLVLILFMSRWPHLVRQGYIYRFATPKLRIWASHGRSERFFSSLSHTRWLESHEHALSSPVCYGMDSRQLPPELHTERSLLRAKYYNVEHQYKAKYYKGLATSNKDDAKEYAQDFAQHQVCIRAAGSDDELFSRLCRNPETRRAIQQDLTVEDVDYLTEDSISVKRFIQAEFVPFMDVCNRRAIPDVCGLKEVHRTILAAFLSGKIKYEDRVARIASHISASMDYPHGEDALAESIKHMAQAFPNANNLPLLVPSGSFGDRACPEAGAARYVMTTAQPYLKHLFPRSDLSCYPMGEEGKTPLQVVPVIPLGLVNGCSGMGYGHATRLPPHHPRDVIRAVRAWISCADALNGDSLSLKAPEVKGPSKGWCPFLTPWFRGVDGPLYLENGRYVSEGVVHVDPEHKSFVISELPVGIFTKSYKEQVLDRKCTDLKLTNVFMEPRQYSVAIHAAVGAPEVLASWCAAGTLLNKLHLKSFVSVSNLKSFNRWDKLHHFSNVEELVDDFCCLRMWMYARRKALMLHELEQQRAKLESQSRYIQLIVAGTLDPRRFVDEQQFESKLGELSFPRLQSSYEYLTCLRIVHLTQARVHALEEQVNQTKQRIDSVRSARIVDMWSQDLDELEASLSAHWSESLQETVSENSKNSKSSKNSRKRGRNAPNL